MSKIRLTSQDSEEAVEVVKKEDGVSAAAPVAAAAPAAVAPDTGEEEEEQTEFDVVLTDAGEKIQVKIQVIKVVRELTGLGLKDAKALVDEVPKPVKEKVSKEEAGSVKEKIEEVGGKVELK